MDGTMPVTHSAETTSRSPDMTHTVPCANLEVKMGCDICDEQYPTREKQAVGAGKYSGEQSIVEAGDDINSLLLSIDRSRTTIQSLLQGNEDRLMKRWRGRTGKKRHAFIRKHFPHAGTDELWNKLVIGRITPQSEQLRALKETILRPILTTNKLLRSWTDLLALIHNRTTYGPREWLPLDVQRIMVIWNVGISELKYVEGCVVIKGPDFGQIRAWDQHLVHRYEACAPHLARAALDMYDKVLTDMVSAVQELTVNTESPQVYASEEWNALVAKDFKVGDNDADIGTFRFWDGFSSAPFPNLTSVLELIRAQTGAEEDELFALETNLAYFLQQVQFMKDGANQNGLPDEWCSSAFVIAEALHNAFLWKMFYEIFMDLEVANQAHLNHASVGADLPEAYYDACRAAHYATNFMHLRAAGLVGFFYLRSPEFKNKSRYTRRDRRKSLSRDPVFQVLDYDTEADLYDDDQLTWCIEQLSKYKHAVPLCLPQVQQILAKDKKIKDQINPLIPIFMNQLTVVWAAQNYLHMHFPCGDCSNLEHSKDLDNKTYIQGIRAARMVWQRESSPKLRNGSYIDQRASNLKVVHHKGRRDAPWLARADAMQREFVFVVKYLLWQSMMDMAQAGCPHRCIDVFPTFWMVKESHLLHPISTNLRARITGGKEKKSSEAEFATFVAFPNEPEEKFQKDHSGQHRKSKSGQLEKQPEQLPNTAIQLPLTAPDQDEQAASSERLLVSRRAYRIAGQLFSDDPPEDKLTLEDICCLMGTQGGAGFKGTSLHGSGYTFRRSGGPAGLAKGVSIHEPHGSTYCFSRLQVKQIATRFHRNFGWTMDTFVEGSNADRVASD
ncbi:hypothetical protein GJ744_008635 [Endocarpon pusillum]|uniref:Uncharacterized protein n=1 Tax=Endocarpon pusillum TaxID=364733 RepID=A0A8H7AKZ6_9EURO|nr:hypothetical protein GJ744_008635 [Endocarpon pusillum]